MPSKETGRIRAAATRATHLRQLHRGPNPLVLPNAWDVMSALIVAAEGAAAVATTSGGVSWSRGRPDGQHLEAEEAVDAVDAITKAVDLPVTADIEGGYGRAPQVLASTVENVVLAGAAGINLEDAPGDGAALLEPRTQAERIAAARAAAQACGVDLVINARTDVFLAGGSSAPLDEVLARSEAYAQAGADCLFVPGLLDLDAIAELVRRSPLPVNIMAGPGAPPVAELAEAGVRRISVGTALAQTAYSSVLRSARELLGAGTYSSLEAELSYAALNGLAQPAHPRRQEDHA